MSSDIASLLRQTMESGTADAPLRLPSVQEILSRIGESDPRAALIARLLAQREAERNEPADAAAIDEEETAEREAEAQRSAEALRHATRPLRILVKRMYAELTELRARNDAFSAALGACHLCWGSDPDCEACEGRGTPGSRRPDRETFGELIGPALRRLRVAPAGAAGAGESAIPPPDPPAPPAPP